MSVILIAARRTSSVRMASSLSRYLMITLMTVLFVSGCQKYGKVSPKAYELATALYSLCNRKDTARLGKVESLIADSTKAAELSSSEEEWLKSIVKSARSGSWESATNAAANDDGGTDTMTRPRGIDIPALVFIRMENLFLENREYSGNDSAFLSGQTYTPVTGRTRSVQKNS